jgi:hypothetical protein
MLKKSLGVLLLLAATALPLFAETVTGSSATPDGEFTWKIVLTSTAEENVYDCRVEVTRSATHEVVFAPAVVFEAGKQAVATTTGAYDGKVTINTDPATGVAMVDLELSKGTVELLGARTQMRLK